MTTTELESIRTRVLEILAREDRAVHTGELAILLQLPTHQIHTALYHPHQSGKLWFISSEGWSLPPGPKKATDANQERLT